MAQKILLDGETLDLAGVAAVARSRVPVALSEESIKKIGVSRDIIEKVLEKGQGVYGVNTGFGKFSNIAIAPDKLDTLQEYLILADAVGVGEPFDTEVVRAIMLLRVNALAKGYSGIRLSTVQTLIDMLNKGVHPIIREKGSVGSSGDLCPLAHMVLPMIGQGEAEYKGKVMAGRAAMEKAGIPVISLKAKEGLALINGTCAMMGPAALAVYDALCIEKSADMIAALTTDALEGITDAFDPRIQKARPHKGQIDVAANMLHMLEGSKLTTRQGQPRMQDAYTLRCVPQIHGASRLAIDYVKSVIETEINSATDNPLIFPDNGDVFSGGNFHGQPVAIAMDTLGIAVAEFANVSERRIERLVNPQLSGMPGFLTPEEGINCGFMVAQYAAAALVSENKVLAHPASVDSIPTSANQEDHVSFGTIAARKARTIVNHAFHVLAIELMCAAQAADFKGKEKLGKGTRAVYDIAREKVTYMEHDRALYPDMDSLFETVSSHSLVTRVEEKVGELK